MMTRLVNIKNTQYIGRAGKGQDGYFGNPFREGVDGSREYILEQYRIYFRDRLERDPIFKRRIEELRGKVLLCFCKPLACHGDIILEYLEPSYTIMYRGEIG